MSPRFEPLAGHGESLRYGVPPQYHASGNLAAVSAGNYYSHATAPPQNQQEPMSNATRYLCAAAYLDPKFASSVIKNLIGSHRAVVPSRGIDLIPIIQHCLRARRMRLVRDVILSILLIFAWVWDGSVPGFVLNIFFLLSFLPAPHWDRRKLGAKKFALAIVTRTLVLMIALSLLLQHYYPSKLNWKQVSPQDMSPKTAEDVSLTFAFFVLFGGVLFVHSYRWYSTLSAWLRPGARVSVFRQSSGRVRRRLGEIDGAQHGNLVLYSGENPFLGTGLTPQGWHRTSAMARPGNRSWSLPIELVRDGAEPSMFGMSRQGTVTIDPVELQHVLRRRLLRLNDPDLPPNERMRHISVDDYVVGEGRFEWTSQLVDQDRKIPFSQVSQDAIDALIRNPQARLRYYQRISISDEGQTVLAARQPVIGAVDQEVVVSAFVHVAVEGHMLYLQFIPTSLPSIRDRYHVIDTLPKLGSGKFVLRVALTAARSANDNLFFAPFRVVRELWMMRKERRDFNKEESSPEDFVFADIGALASVRELGAGPGPRTFIQALDRTKYTQIVERLVLDTVLDFLVEKNVNTDAYRAASQIVYNNGIIASGDVRDTQVHS